MESLSVAQARRIALAAQGFLDKPHAVPTMRTFQRTLERTGVLQVDSVNVLQRAHYMPLYSRMGPYDVDLLRRAAEERPRRIVEYWAHVQAFMPVELWPVMQHRMDVVPRQARQVGLRRRQRRARAEPARRARATAAPRPRATSTTGCRAPKDNWGWNWSETRKMLDYLYTSGQVAIAGRNSQFEIRYDLPERVIPPAVLAQPTPTRAEAGRELVRRAARSHGVATVQDLRDYYRMPVADTATAVAELVEEGELLPVTVEGWKRPAYLHRDARLPRRVDARALLSPFDPVVWERARTEALFDFHYRIEIYVPADKRVHGYYVLPFLLGDRIVARVDLKADRQFDAGAAGWSSRRRTPSRAPPETAERALGRAAPARRTGSASPTITVEPRGDLAPALRSAGVGAG